jgi:hypothetical protein
MKAKQIIKKFKSAKVKARHGDVIIIADNSPMKDAGPAPSLADGEVTGHAHRVSSGDAEVKKVAETTVQRLLKVTAEKAFIDHEEHKKNAVPKGQYRSSIQATWTPEGLRRVED